MRKSVAWGRVIIEQLYRIGLKRSKKDEKSSEQEQVKGFA